MPREIVIELDIKPGDEIVWKLFESGKLEVALRQKKE